MRKARTLLIEGVPDRKVNSTTTLEAHRRNFQDKNNLVNDSSYYDTLKVAWVTDYRSLGYCGRLLLFLISHNREAMS